MVEKYKGIKLTFDVGTLQVESRNSDNEDAADEMGIEYQGDEVSIGFHVGYLLDILSAMNCQNVAMDFMDGMSSAVLRDPEDNDRLYVVMPMRL